MSGTDARVSEWIDRTAEILAAPVGGFPAEQIARGLRTTFGAQVAYLHVLSADRTVRLKPFASADYPDNGRTLEQVVQVMVEAANSRLYNQHPLVVWYREVGGATPQSARRVPREMGMRSEFQIAFEVLHAVGADQEMAIPLNLGESVAAIGLTRSGSEDWSDEDLIVAARLQPLFAAMYRQSSLIEPFAADDAVSAFGLTGRELAVLQLLATGQTSGAIGSTLGCSYRTVQKHVEHLYRKLGVSDRVSATLIGRRSGIA